MPTISGVEGMRPSNSSCLALPGRTGPPLSLAAAHHPVGRALSETRSPAARDLVSRGEFRSLRPSGGRRPAEPPLRRDLGSSDQRPPGGPRPRDSSMTNARNASGSPKAQRRRLPTGPSTPTYCPDSRVRYARLGARWPCSKTPSRLRVVRTTNRSRPIRRRSERT